MDELANLRTGLGGIFLLSDAETRSISAENPDGAKGGGGRAEPSGHGCRLGKGWKCRPCLPVQAGQTLTLADVKGPGVIQHIWITTAPVALRNCVLRMYWDDEPTPSVETPLGDFFACGHGVRALVSSLPIAANPAGGLNCYWPMPFARRARITLENRGAEDIGSLYYQVTYALAAVPEGAAMLHAQWRRDVTSREAPDHVILDGVKGRGQYVGTYLAWTQMTDGWWGEGEIKFFLDGDAEYPTICGTGTEDYFGGAWNFGGAGPAQDGATPFCSPFTGYPLRLVPAGAVPKHGLYRWHILDPIRFRQDLRVTIQALGWSARDKAPSPLADDIASTAYWYQTEPHAPFPSLGPGTELLTR